jgi:hypothetical protein
MMIPRGLNHLGVFSGSTFYNCVKTKLCTCYYIIIICCRCLALEAVSLYLTLLWVMWYHTVYCKGMCIFVEHAQYTCKNYSNAQQWICLNLLYVRHNKKSISPTNCQFRTRILTALVNELHLWHLQSSCGPITKFNYEVRYIKIFGPYMYMYIIAKQLPYFPAHKTHFCFPEKCDLNLTCILCAKGKYYFQTYK